MQAYRPSSSDLYKHRQLLVENPAPFVTASAWIIIDEGSKGEMLFGKNETESRQVASLTKIMTSFVVLKLLDYYQMSEHSC